MVAMSKPMRADYGVDSLIVAPGDVNRDPRIQSMEIPGELVQIVLTVIDEGAAPIVGAEARVLGHPSASPLRSDADGRIVIACIEMPIAVKVGAFGYRDVVMRDLESDSRVSLGHGVPVRFVTTAAVCGREPRYQLGLRVSYGAGHADEGMPIHAYSTPEATLWFDVHGELARRLPGPGEYRLTPFVRVETDGPPVVADVSLTEPTVIVRDEDPLQTFVVDVPADVLLATVSRLAGR